MQLIHTASSKYLEYGRGRVLQLIQLLQSADDVVELGIRTAANPLMSVIDKDPNSFTSALSGSRGFKQAPRDVVNSRHAQLVLELPHLELQQLLLFLLHTADSQQLVLPTVLRFTIQHCATAAIRSKTTGNGGRNAGQAGCITRCMELLGRLTS